VRKVLTKTADGDLFPETAARTTDPLCETADKATDPTLEVADRVKDLTADRVIDPSADRMIDPSEDRVIDPSVDRVIDREATDPFRETLDKARDPQLQTAEPFVRISRDLVCLFKTFHSMPVGKI
jgi:hypothetical protein